MSPKIDPEFQALIPPLSEEERAQLEANLVKDGCRDPLVVWAGHDILLDGHTRLEICTRRGIDFKTVEIQLADREAAADWIDCNQLGRRNLKPDQMTMLIGRRYNRAKKAVPNPQGIGGKSGKIVKDQNDPQQTTADRLAKEHGVSAPTVKRAGAFVAAVEKLKEIDPDIEKKVMAGTAPPKAAVVEAAKLVDEKPEAAKTLLEKPKPAIKHPKVAKPAVRGSWENTRNLEDTLKQIKDIIAEIADLHPEKSTRHRITDLARDIVKALERLISRIEKE